MNPQNKPFTIALPAGRMSEESIEFFARIGFARFVGPSSRELSFNDETGKIRVLLVRNQDVPLCLLHGGAEAGVCGRDVLLENNYDLTMPVDLPFGHCRLSIACPEKSAGELLKKPHLRAATKYPNLASRWFHERGISCEIIKMHGSIEVAPLIGISDCIVDLVSTGNTLRANGLVEVEVVQESSALLLVNRSAYALQSGMIMDLIHRALQGIGQRSGS